MEFKQLEYFLEMCRDFNLTATAKRIAITQQGLSKAISALEKELGCQLIVRARQGESAYLTPAGEKLREHAEEIMSSYKRTLIDMDEYSEHKRLSVSVTGGVSLCLPLDFFKRFESEHPDIRLCVRERKNDECIRALKHGDCDLIIAIPNKLTNQLLSLRLISAPLCLVVPQEHPLAGRQEVSLSELGNEPLIIQDDSEMGDFTEKCSERGISLNIAVQSYDMLGLFRLCASRNMCGITLRALSDHVSQENLVAIPLSDDSVTWEPTLMRLTSAPSRAQDAFWDYCARSFS